MSDNIVRMNQSFLDLYNEIEKGVSDIAQNIGRLPDEELTESKYKELSRRLDGIQVQFDRTSDAIKNLTLDQTNPELYEILEKKADLNKKYGFFHHIRSELKKRFEKLHNIDHERDFERTREERTFVPVQEEEEPEEEIQDGWDPLQEEEDALAAALLAADEQAEKNAAWVARQKDLAAFAQGNQERRYAEQERREEAARQLGLRKDQDRFYSEAELRNERIRQEEARLQEAQAARDRIAREQAMFTEYRRRMEAVENFEGLGKGHLDYSTYTGAAAPSPSGPSQNTPFPYEQTPNEYTAEAIKGGPEGYADAAAVYGTNNRVIYDWLRSPEFKQTAEPGQPVTVSSVVEQQMRANVDAARQDYEAAYGTAREAEASRRFLQERRFYEEFHQEIKANHYEIPQPVYEPAPVRTSEPSQRPEGAPVTYDRVATWESYKVPAATIPVTHNQDIYDWIRSPAYSQPAESGRPIGVSSAIEQQMRTNVDAARMDYEASRGTYREAETAQRYIYERRVYEDFHQEVKAQRYVISQPVYEPAPTRPAEPTKGAESAPASYDRPETRETYAAPTAPAVEIPVTQNRDIYDWIRSPEYSKPAESGKPVAVSFAIEQQMRTNVEAARLDYEASRGTYREAETAQRYIYERRAYEDFHQEVKAQRYEVPLPAPTRFAEPNKGAESAPASYVQPETWKAYEAPTAPTTTIPVTQNRDIYDWIRSPEYGQPAESGKPVVVSFAIEQQMRTNVEAARVEYETFRGTDREAEAAQRYIQERRAYEDFHQEVKAQRYEVPQPVYEPAPTRSAEPTKGAESAPASYAQPETWKAYEAPTAPTTTIPVTQNRDIYDWIRSPEYGQPAESGKPVVVSFAIEQQMRTNVEAARVEYEAFRGTDREAEAAQRYIQERRAYEDFHQEVKAQRYEVPQPVYEPAPTRSAEPTKGAESAPASYAQPETWKAYDAPTAPTTTIPVTQNRDIYDWIRSPEYGQPAESGKPVVVSFAIEQQMRTNVEAARVEYEAFRGTDREAEAAQRYIQERRAYEDFHQEVKAQRYEVPQPVYEPAPTRSAEPTKGTESAPAGYAQPETWKAHEIPTAPVAAIPATQNRDIYDWLRSPAYSQPTVFGKPVVVSFAIEQQMRTNVEAARVAYEVAKGTDQEASAAQRYLQERRAYEDFHKEVKAHRYEVPQTAYQPILEKTTEPSRVQNLVASYEAYTVPSAPEAAIPVTQNRDIYDWLSSPAYSQSAEPGKPIAVSSAIEQQMRTNVETARLDYEASKGTDREDSAAQRYLQERNVYEDFHQEIKAQRYEVQQPLPPVIDPALTDPLAPSSATESAPTGKDRPEGKEAFAAPTAPAATIPATQNRDIYDWIRSPEYGQPTEPGRPLVVSSALEQQLRANVEVARLDYEAAKGTDREASAAQRYLQERYAYEDFHRDVKAHHFEVQQPIQPVFHPALTDSLASAKRAEPIPAAHDQLGAKEAPKQPTAATATVPVTQNRDIYDWISSPDYSQPAEPGKAIVVPSAVEQQMRANVDAARLDYEAAKGTDREASATQRYLQERTAYEQFREAVKTNHFEISRSIGRDSIPAAQAFGKEADIVQPLQAAPFEPISASSAANVFVLSNNKEIYNWIKSPEYSLSASGNRAVRISSDLADRMKNNVETARLFYEAAKGTEDEAFATQKYLQERGFYEDFCRDIKNSRFKVIDDKSLGVEPSQRAFGAAPVLTKAKTPSPAIVSAKESFATEVSITANKDIYDWLQKPEYRIPGADSQIATVSTAIEQQMQVNVEAARLEYEAARGTAGEKAALERFQEERSVYENFRKDVREQRFEIQPPVREIGDLKPSAVVTTADIVSPGKADSSEIPASLTGNRDIYDWIKAPQHASEASGPIVVSSAVMKQMAANVEAARLEYESARGTDREAEATQKFLQERTTFEYFREDVRGNRIEIIEQKSGATVGTLAQSGPKMPDAGITDTGIIHEKTPVQTAVKASETSDTTASMFVSFTPEGVDSLTVEDGTFMQPLVVPGKAGTKQVPPTTFAGTVLPSSEAFKNTLVGAVEIPQGISGNENIYNWLQSKAPAAAESGKALSVSAALVQQMRTNVETARVAYEAAKGTDKEASAAQKFMQEHTAFERFREDVKGQRIEVADRTLTAPVSGILQAPRKTPEAGITGPGFTPVKPTVDKTVKASDAAGAPGSMFVTFTPEGVESVAIEAGAPMEPLVMPGSSGMKQMAPGIQPSVGTTLPSLEEFRSSLKVTGDISHTAIGNESIYAWLQSKAPTSAEAGKSVAVSAAFVEQMRLNVEAAHADYQAVRGTPKEQAAAHRYLEERTAFANFRKDVKNKRFEIADPVHKTPAAPAEGKVAGKSSEKAAAAPFQSPFVSFTPEGAEAVMVENGKLTKSSMVYNNPGLKTVLPLSADNPMMVHPEYENMLHANMKAASAALNAMVASGDSAKSAVLPGHVSSDIKLAMQAYLGFKSAKAAGTVVVSESAPKATPDFRIWQQQYVAKASGKNISKVLGATGQYRGINQNKLSKKDVKEISSLLTKREYSLKRQTVAGTYFSIAGSRFLHSGVTVGSHFTRKMYQLMQSGEDNALRTGDTVRQYATTAYLVAQAVRHANPVFTTAHASAKMFRNEVMLYGKLAFLDKGTLAKQITEHRKTASALGKEIRTLMQKGASLTKEERASLAEMIRKRQSLGHQLRKEISFSKFHAQNEAMVAAAKELKSKHRGFVTSKHIREEITELRNAHQTEISKKFGALARVKDKSLSRKIAELEKINPRLKAKIKQLQAKGSALTAAERVQLKQLMNKHKDNSLLLRKLKGLSAAKRDMDVKVGALERLLKQVEKNKAAWSSAGFTLRSLMLRPLFESDESGAQGLAKGSEIAVNPHVRKLVKKPLKMAMNAAKKTFKKASEHTAKKQAAKAGKATAKTATKLTTRTIKTGVNTATKLTAKTAKSATTTTVKTAQSGIRTSAEAVRQAAVAAKATVKVAATVVKKVAEGVAEFVQKIAAAIEAIGAEACLVILAIILVVGVIIGLITIFGGGAASIIVGDDIVGGKTRISSYVEILEDMEEHWEYTIMSTTTLGSYDGYENVSITYSTPKRYNYKEIIAMMYVKMNYSLQDKEAIEAYIKDLFTISHTYSVTETTWYCGGCEEKKKTEYVTCPAGDCQYSEDGGICLGHFITETWYECPGHMDVHIVKTVLTFDELFEADDNRKWITSGYGGIGVFDPTLGGVSAKYEAGGINPGKISSGAGDHGGQSYGTWQLSSAMGSVDSFINWIGAEVYVTPHSDIIYANLSKYEPATAQFNLAWDNMAATYYDEFQELQAQYMYSTYVLVFLSKAYQTYGVNLERSKALLELAFSTSVQFGPANVSVLGNINASMTDEEIISTCYAYKRDNVDTLFRSSSVAIRQSLKNNRFKYEEKDLLSLVGVDFDTPIPDEEEDFWVEGKRTNVMFICEQDWQELYDMYFSLSTGKPIKSD